MTTRATSAFAGFRFPPEVISAAVRWYLRYGRLATIAGRAATGMQGAVPAVTGIVAIVIGWALFASTSSAR